MKIFKKIVFSFLSVLVISLVGGYLYFDKKFTPEKNYLTLQNESGKIIIKWLGTDKNAVLLPIRFSESDTFYMQFDTGSPNTVFYSNSITAIKDISVKNNRAKSCFNIGNTKVSSDKFIIIDGIKQEKTDSLKIIGTIGADILEDRKTLINFNENYVTLNISKEPINFRKSLIDFKFKKRKVILEGFLKDKKEKFLYDSGTSAYELLTNKNLWTQLKSSNSNVVEKKERSWDNILTSYTAKSRNSILFKNHPIALNEVTYVEGFSKSQYLMMKFSGMTGMLGNKMFIKSSIYIDCRKQKIAIQ